jgi:hypothetical protein
MRAATIVLGWALLALPLESTPASAQVLLGYLLGGKLSSETFQMGFEVGANFTTG